MSETKGEGVLFGWEAIAGHLAVGEKTARRWAAERGLPVYRLVGRVEAIPSELDAWRDAERGRAG